VAIPPENRDMPPGLDAAEAMAELRLRDKIEAEYALEWPVRCPSCGETISRLKAVRLLRTQVNFTSTLPRRGRVVVCPNCYVVLPAELTNF
jgi:predicted RNA-binding Zn-ribbon protein involved in translation (DUF1610 family)